MYRAYEDGVIEGHIGVALDLDCDDENLNNLILNMRDEYYQPGSKKNEDESIQKAEAKSEN